MKRISMLFLVLCLMVLGAPLAGAGWVSLNGAQEGTLPEVSMQRSNADSVVVSVDIPGFYVDEKPMNGDVYHSIRVPDAARSLEIGSPEVPKVTVKIVIPDLGSVSVRELDRKAQNLNGFVVSPLQAPTTDLDPKPEFVINSKLYADGSFPLSTVVANAPAINRDVRFVSVDVYPIIATPADASIKAASQVTFELTFNDAPGQNEKVLERGFISPELDNMYRKMFINYDAMSFEAGKRDSNVRYLIISDDDHIAAIQPLADWWNRAGLMVEILGTSTAGSTATAVKATIQDYYTNENTEFVLLVGETNEIALGNTGSQDPGDYNYQLLEGSDDFADIALGRILQDDNSVIEHIVARTLNYVLHPPTDGWLNKTMLCAHEEEYPGKYTECKEQIRTYSYAIDTLVHDTYYPPEGATHAMVEAAMLEGRGVVNYRGHGDNDYWTWSPDWDVQHVHGLDNGAYTPIVWNIACYNGNVTIGTECLSEAWQNAGASGEGGAVANIGATEPSYTIANHAFDKMLYRAPWDEGISRFGYTVNRAKEHMINEEGSYGVDNAYMYLVFGDPAIDIPGRTLFEPEMSHLPTVSMGGGSFEVTIMEEGSPVEGAMVCAMKSDEGLYEVGYTDATGTVSLNTLLTSGGTMMLTATAHNMKPYMADILVQAAGCGAVLLDRGLYNCDQELAVRVWDSDLNTNPGIAETAEVEISSDSEPTPETVILTETGPDSGEFMGTIMTSDSQSGTGYLQVSHNDTITVVYQDADCEGSPVSVDDTAGVDCEGPVITDVSIDEIETDFFTVSWTTSEPAMSEFTWGDTTPPTIVEVDNSMRTDHSITIADIEDCTQFYFMIMGTDAGGNIALDNNGGSYYSLTTYELVVMLEANMDVDPGWTYEGMWAFGVPQGNEGDPTSGNTGENVVGYNLAGDYTNSMSATYCTTNTFDCSTADEVIFTFYKWLGVESATYDHASIEVSNNGGSTWSQIWNHTGSSGTSSAWEYVEFDITTIAAGNPDVQIRWVMGSTDTSVTYCGWNVDDVLVSYTTECTSGPTPTPTPECLNHGDVNLDGAVTAGDAQMGFQIALGSYTPTELEECAADCNGDGDVTAGDAQGVFMTALGSGSCADPV